MAFRSSYNIFRSVLRPQMSVHSSCSCLVITFAEILTVVASDKRFGLVNTQQAVGCKTVRSELRSFGQSLFSVAPVTAYLLSTPRLLEFVPQNAPPPAPINVDDVMNPEQRGQPFLGGEGEILVKCSSSESCTSRPAAVRLFLGTEQFMCSELESQQALREVLNLFSRWALRCVGGRSLCGL